MKLYDWQIRDQETLAANNFTAAAIIQPGGGKTILAAQAGINSGAQVKLLVAPEGTYHDYETTIRALGDDSPVQVLGSDKKGKKAFSDLAFRVPGWYFTTPQLLARDKGWKSVDVDLFIIDEAHQVLSYGTKAYYHAVGRVGPKGNLYGAVKAKMRIAMSGTPVRNKFENWYAIARFLWPERNKPGDIADSLRNRWLEQNMDSIYDRFAHGNKKYTKERFPGAFVNRLPAVIQHFRRARCCEWHPEGFLADLKEPQEFHETIHLAPAQVKAIKELEESYVTWLKDNPLQVTIPITLFQRIRQLTLGVPTVVMEDDGTVTIDFEDDCPSPAMDRALEIVGQFPDEPVVVFTSSRAFAPIATKRFNDAGFYALEHSGNVKKRDREFAKGELKSGKLRVLVTTIAAGGTGLNLQAAGVEIWLDQDVDPTNSIQGLARTDRMGQTRQVQRFILHDHLGVSEGIYDRRIQKQVELNKSNRRKV